MKSFFSDWFSAIFTFLYYSEAIKNLSNFTIAQILIKELFLERYALQKIASNLVKVKIYNFVWLSMLVGCSSYHNLDQNLLFLTREWRWIFRDEIYQQRVKIHL